MSSESKVNHCCIAVDVDHVVARIHRAVVFGGQLPHMFDKLSLRLQGPIIGAKDAIIGDLFDGDDYFSASVPFFQIPNGIRHLAQPVTPVDHRCYFSGTHEFAQNPQVLLA